MDADVLMEVDLAAYTAALERSVFWPKPAVINR